MTRARLDLRRLERIVKRFSEVRLLVVGDVILDEYLWGDVERISPEAPVPVVHVSRESTVLGGAGNVARNVVAMGGECTFCAVVGDDPAGRRVLDLLKDLGVDPNGLVVLEGRPTTRKTRVVARSQQVVRFDRETDSEIPRSATRELLEIIEGALPSCDAAVIEDYGKGMLTRGFLNAAMKRLRGAEIPVAVDPKNEPSFAKGASLCKPNLREIEQLTGIAVRSPEDMVRAVAALRRKVGPADVVVTRGGEGMTVFEGKNAPVEVRTAPREVFDVQGAGDTTIAALVLARSAGASLHEAAVIANAAAGIVVSKIGTATASPSELLEALPETIAAARGMH